MGSSRGIWTAQRANLLFKEIMPVLKYHLCGDGLEALKDFVSRRKAEGGAPTDFKKKD
ncbi:MAG: hypothetical protein CM1200mP30_21290 [Pseudomonadota bacterium]|nr:MAG: hypothetical protein CM1200mP30_21290 [Pseudomonadota bacterium]